ncbi:hypothetical protein IV203_013713 [Nitzschia inconspicua]|uniref:Uncharacterized protein n=1 Tax=Nitzschia inconspicua TaxID=303405 RepID=A0A9K3M5M8_9STRA|nr:hypothetical protein IV203_013713 [Nitzschia inconspicua]
MVPSSEGSKTSLSVSSSLHCRFDANKEVVRTPLDDELCDNVSVNSRTGLPFGSTMLSRDKRSYHSLQKWSAPLTESLVNYWYNDLPPLYGPLRMIFYFMYWLITYHAKHFLFHSRPTRETFYSNSCVDTLVDSIPHFGNLGFEYKREGGLFNYIFLEPGNEFLLKLNPYWICSSLTWAFWSGLVLSSIGLGGKVPRCMVAISFWMLFGIRNSRFVGESSHSHYLAGMAMVALCFAENNLIDAWSVDYWIYRCYLRMKGQQQSYPTPESLRITSALKVGPSAGGAARKYVLFMSVCSIFFAGMHKFSTWGFKWMDGETLYDCLESEHSHWEFVHDIFVNNRSLITLLAIGTIIGEIGAFAVLFFPGWRPYGIASFYAFHIGVFALMQPNFISNEVTYLLIIDWRLLWAKMTTRINHCSLIRTRGWCATKTNASPDLKSTLALSKDSQLLKIPCSWKVGAWIYTLFAMAVLVTSVCRIDAFPFFSWTLYNWHPSEPGNQSPYTKEVAQEAAHRCLTKPPFNPACQNHGTTRHHDLFPQGIKEYLYTVTITGIKEGANVTSPNKRKLCPLAIYVNWEPVSCEAIDKRVTVQQQLVNIIGNASATTQYDDDESPSWGLLPATDIARTLRRYAVDAAAAAIEEGPSCFKDGAEWTQIQNEEYDLWWSSDERPMNAVSRFSRQIRTYMNKPENEGEYVGEGREVLAVGVVFEYLKGYNNQKEQFNSCMLGKSLYGENVEEAFSNHHVGGTLVKSQLPSGDWSETYNEMLLIILLCIGTIVFPHIFTFFQSLQLKPTKQNKLSLWFCLLTFIVSTQIILGTFSIT